MKGQASMIDILLLALFISIVLIGSSVFIGKEELRAQRGREEAVFAQTQLVTTLNYRLDSWDNRTAAEMINTKFCERSMTTVNSTSCSLSDQFYLEMQKMTNRTGRTSYNYIFFAEAINSTKTIGNFTVCNHQPTVCAKHIPAIATTEMVIPCPSGEYVQIFYMHGIWPDWLELPLTCED